MLSRSSASRWLILGPFLAGVVLLAALGVASVDMMSAVRAYVGGESHWSKGQKDALYHLGRYTQSFDAHDYERFLEALAVPLGDRQARLELEKSVPDLALVRRGLTAGGNHPDDVDGMIMLYRRFRNVSFMSDAIAIWAAADADVMELSTLATQAQALIAAGDTRSVRLQALLLRLPDLNRRLTGLEQRFSAKLGDASRTLQELMQIAIGLLALVLGTSGAAVMLGLMRWQARVDADLHESDERWAWAAEASRIGLLDWNVETDEVVLDARAAALYGLPQGPEHRAAEQLARDCVHPADSGRLRKALRNAITALEPVVIRYRVLHADASEHRLELSAHVRTDHRGLHMIGILRDIGDDMRAAQLLLDKEAAERANRAKGEFLSRVSHELRTPLNSVLGFAELMQTDESEPLSDAQRQRMQQIWDGGRHLLALVNDIVDLTRLEDGQPLLTLQHLDPAPLLRSALKKMQPLALAQKISLECGFLGDAIRVHADQRRLEQVLVHLLTNAILYNRPSGKVSVALSDEGEQAVITVRDTGIGMNADQLAQLYQPFNRLGAELTQIKGSGLGLVISQQLVKRMGGSLAVNSQPGVGSSFSVRLPARPVPATAPSTHTEIA